jgi:hypothetical protein
LSNVYAPTPTPKPTATPSASPSASAVATSIASIVPGEELPHNGPAMDMALALSGGVITGGYVYSKARTRALKAKLSRIQVL